MEKRSIEKTIRKNIYDKTGMMFFNTTTQVSYIIPRNLREIVNLVSKLEKMPIPEKEDPNRREIKTKNFYEFREFFLNHWVEENLADNQKEIIKEIYTRDIEEKNKFTVQILDEIYGSKIVKRSKRDGRTTEYKQLDEYLNIINFLNKSENISLGDLLLVLDTINKSIKKDYDKKFIFAIKTLYSMLLYDYIRNIKNKNNVEMSVFKYKNLINGYIRNDVIHKNNFIITSEIEEDKKYRELYKENEEVIEWLDNFIVRRAYNSKKNKNGEETKTKLKNYRISDRQFKYKKYEKINNNGFDFEIYGFLFNNIQEILETEGSLYIGNIEMLERMLKFKYDQPKNISFFDRTTGFIKELLKYIYEEIQENNEFTSVKLIEYEKNKIIIKNEFLNESIGISNGELRKEICKIYGYDYLDYTKYKEDISFKTNIVNKDALKGDIENIKNKLENRNIENINDINEALDKFKEEIIKGRYEAEYKNILQLKMQLAISKASKDEKFIKDIEEEISNKTTYYIEEAKNKTELEHYKEAIKDYDKAIELNSEDKYCYYKRGICKNKQEEYEEAIKDFDSAIRLDSNNANYYNNRGIANIYLENYKKVVSDCNEAIELNPKISDYYNTRAKALYELKNYKEALLDCNKAIELNPTIGLYYNNKGRVKHQLKDYEEALLDYDKALNLEPNNEMFKNNRENCIKQMKKAE